jgi:hypothetical protein
VFDQLQFPCDGPAPSRYIFPCYRLFPHEPVIDRQLKLPNRSAICRRLSGTHSQLPLGLKKKETANRKSLLQSSLAPASTSHHFTSFPHNQSCGSPRPSQSSRVYNVVVEPIPPSLRHPTSTLTISSKFIKVLSHLIIYLIYPSSTTFFYTTPHYRSNGCVVNHAHSCSPRRFAHHRSSRSCASFWPHFRLD